MRPTWENIMSTFASQPKSILTVLSLFLPIAAVACGGFDSSDDPSGTGPGVSLPEKKDPSKQEGEGATAPPVPLPGTPTEDLITEQYGVFVSPSGKPDADGSRSKPFSTITKGIEQGKKTSKHVYVCEGTFSESIAIERGISIIGGFDCSAPVWKKTTKTTRINAPSSPAMKATNIDIATRIESLEVYAPNGTPAATTSIGLHAKSAPALVIASSKIAAGRAAAGADGSEGVQLTLGPAANGQAGLTSRYVVNGNYAVQEGGAGGVGQCLGAPGHDGENGGAGGAGGSFECPNSSSVYYQTEAFGLVIVFKPGPGQYRSGGAGAAGANGLSANAGALTADGFNPGNGVAGSNGQPGSGGAGSTGDEGLYVACAAPWVSSSAAGGGAGGCPGLAGSAGAGGGASIGILAASSIGLTIDASEISADDGGAGGVGSFGSSATVGGQSGAGRPSYPGGNGGASGVSGSGAGGPSYAIAHTNGEVKLTGNARLKHGRGGASVAARTALQLGVTKTIAASAAGDAKDVQSF
jgi:hypothetical protein